MKELPGFDQVILAGFSAAPPGAPLTRAFPGGFESGFPNVAERQSLGG